MEKTQEDLALLAEQALAKAKTKMLLKLPFYASIMMRLPLTLSDTEQTMATDSKQILYNPKFVVELSKETNGSTLISSVLCHEVMHIVLKHTHRFGNRNHMLWNIACDYAVNLILADDMMPLPKDALLDKRYTNMTAEDIYEKLLKENPPSGRMIGNITQAPSGESEDAIDAMIAEAYATAKARGIKSVNIDRIVAEAIYPTLGWKDILANFFAEVVKSDYSWTVPNVRYSYSGLYLPSLNTKSLKPLSIVMDTSGSVEQKEINEFASELVGILSVSPDTEADIIYADAEVCGEQTVSLTDLELTPKGGGGTDYVPAFNRIAEAEKDYCCCIYFTDGYCHSFPSEVPEMPVLWALSKDSYQRFSPPFGQVIRIGV